ncbi:MAG: AAA family ATPase [Candidatus Sericytochromatia bacterium]|nr:AAA family ATPase [Candidatus Sericytochromatia bacterium]
MNAFIVGNAGSGKSTFARRLAQQSGAICLSLDAIAFESGTSQRRPLADSLAAAEAFMDQHSQWVLEGCYADIFEALLSRAEALYFLNPGTAACIAHCRARRWEPDKFASPAEQATQLEALIPWVSSYDTRDDAYGLRQHRALFEAFQGPKYEFTDPAAYA